MNTVPNLKIKKENEQNNSDKSQSYLSISEHRRLKSELMKIKLSSKNKELKEREKKISELIDKAVQRNKNLEDKANEKRAPSLNVTLPEQIIFSFDCKDDSTSIKKYSSCIFPKIIIPSKTIAWLSLAVTCLFILSLKVNKRTSYQETESNNTEIYDEIKLITNGSFTENKSFDIDLKNISVEKVFVSPFGNKLFVNCKNSAGETFTMELERKNGNIELLDIEL